MASVPAYSQSDAAMDKKLLDDCIKKFNGTRTVSPAADGKLFCMCSLFSRLNCDTGNWHFKGMKTTLKHHQVIGASFMIERENGTDEPRGGIQADAMGESVGPKAPSNILTQDRSGQDVDDFGACAEQPTKPRGEGAGNLDHRLTCHYETGRELRHNHLLHAR